MNLPNWITLSRIGITIVAFACLESIAEPQTCGPTAATSVLGWWAFGLFMVAAVTDFIDGYLARQFGQVTAFGRVADPFADKFLICGILITMLRFPAVAAIMPGWFVVIVVMRELLVTTLRGLCESQGLEFPADRLGKLKMLVQSATAAALLTMIAGCAVFVSVGEIGVWVTLVLTVISGANYTWKARGALFAS